MAFDFEQLTEQFLNIAMGIDAIAMELEASRQDDVSKDSIARRLKALSPCLQDLSAEVAADVAVRHAVNIPSSFHASGMPFRESEQRYRDFFDNVSDLLWLLSVTPDSRFQFIEVNLAAEKLIGLTRPEIVGRYIDEIVSYVPQRIGDHLLQCVQDRTTVNEELEIDLSHGRHTFDVTLIPVTDGATGHVCRIVCAARDVTLRKRYDTMQQENAELASRLRKLTAIAPGIIGDYLMSPDGHVTMPSASPRLEEITGWKCEELMKDASLALRSIHPDDLERHVASIEESARTLHAWRDEFRVSHPAKGEIWIEGRSIPEREPDGSIRWHGFLHDVTERKRAEERLNANEQQLRALAKRREEDIEEERRRIARELHDELGQQLVALRMNITLLDIQFGNEQCQMGEATERMLALVDTLIQSTRDVSASLRPTMLDMGLIPALEWLTANFTRHSGMRCYLQVPQGEVGMTDEQAVAIFRIAQESLTNAARHSKAKRVDLVFRCEPEAFVIEIKDNGIGFDVQGIRKPNTFGLVGMRERALGARGEIDVVSKRGRGALVRVRIPVVGTITSSSGSHNA